MWFITSYIFIVFCGFAFPLQQTKDVDAYNNLIKLITDYQDLHHFSNIYISRTSSAGNLLVSTRLLNLLKYFSKQNVYCMVTKILDMTKYFDQNNKRSGRTLFIVVIRSMHDFEKFSGITRTKNLSLYEILVVFKDMIDFCHKPIGNPFNLVFSTRMLIRCEDSSIIREWYSLEPNKTEVLEFLNWEPDDIGFTPLTTLNFQERRNSLNGINLRVSFLEGNEVKGDFFGSLMIEIAEIVDFKIDYQSSETYTGGSYDPKTKKWNGVIGLLDDKKTDIGVGEFTMTVERLDVVDFSDPVSISKTNFYVKKSQEYYLMWSMYYKVFGLRASYCLLLFILVSPMIIALTMITKKKKSFRSNSYDNYFQVWAIFCGQSIEFPEYSSTRIAYYSLFLLSFILYSTYSALIVSYLTIFEPDLPFNSIDDFINDKNYRLTTIKNTSYTDSFKDSEDLLMQKLNDYLLDDTKLPSSLSNACEQTCDDEMKVVLYMDETIMKSQKSQMPCELIPFDRSRLSGMSFTFIRNSPYVKIINYHLQRMRDFGILNAIETRSLRQPKSQPIVYMEVDLWSTIPLFTILCLGMLLSIVVLISENIFRYYCNRFNRILLME